MFRKFRIAVVLLLCGCHTINAPENFVYKEIQTDGFKLASWQKITDTYAPVKVYIEGDGASFTPMGRATNDPTPKVTVLREIAYGDASPNVVYLARPCQFVDDNKCVQKYWTTARFAPEVIRSTADVIKYVAGERDVVLIGFSGGAQVAGLVAVIYPEIKVRQLVTIAANLDHLAWTDYHRVPSLSESLNLADYKGAYLRFPQVHYVGTKDKVMPAFLIEDFAPEGTIVRVDGASHTKRWNKIYSDIRAAD